jgi:putative IMPACT (imprinted ancient) family translation regulator
VVRYFGGILLGAGGLVWAYTDCVAQTLKSASKVPIFKLRTLQCFVPYSMEGLLRRELEAGGGALLSVQHGAAVELTFSMAETSASALVAHLNEEGQGRISWQDTKGQ